MNLRSTTPKLISPKEIHISTVKFKYVKRITTNKHFSCFAYSITYSGLYGTKGKKLYKILITSTRQRVYFKLIEVNIKSYFKGNFYSNKNADEFIFESEFTGNAGKYPTISKYMQSLLDDKKLDYLYSIQNINGLLELLNALYVKKYKTARLKNESKIIRSKNISTET